MQNLFVKEDDVIEIKFTVAADAKGTIFCDIDKEKLISGLKEINANIEDYEFKDYVANFKKPNFGVTISLYDSVFITNGQDVSFNPITARFRKITLLIKDWDLTGELKTPTEAEIQSLNPIIANVIGEQLEIETGGILG